MDRANLEGQTILVMEGEVLIALDLRLVLEQAGAQVHVVRNAAEAFVTEGSGVVIVNGHKTRLKAGTIVLIEAGDRHEIRNTGRTLLKTVSVYLPPAYRDEENELPAGRGE